MINITESAAARVQEIFVQQQTTGYLRLYVTGFG